MNHFTSKWHFVFSLCLLFSSLIVFADDSEDDDDLIERLSKVVDFSEESAYSTRRLPPKPALVVTPPRYIASQPLTSSSVPSLSSKRSRAFPQSLHVLEQNEVAFSTFRIREIHPHDSAMRKDAAPAYRGPAVPVVSFAVPGTQPIFLNNKKELFSSNRKLLDDVRFLEQSSAPEVFVVSGDEQMLSVVGADLEVRKLLQLGNFAGPITDVYRVNEDVVWLMTSEGMLFEMSMQQKKIWQRFSVKSITKESAPKRLFVSSDVLWVLDLNGRLHSVDTAKGAVRSLDLPPFLQKMQDGHLIEPIYTKGKPLGLRVGSNLYEFVPADAGHSISYRIIEQNFFLGGLHEYGVSSGLFTRVLVARACDGLLRY